MFQKPVIVSSPTADATAKLGELRAKAGELKIKLSDLDSRRVQLVEQGTQAATGAGRSAVNKALAVVQHDLATTQVQLEQINAQIDELQTERDLTRAFSLQGPPSTGIATTAPPNPWLTSSDPWFSPKEITIGSGVFLLLLPLVLVLARRLWVRGVPRTAVDLENSPRLQRIEQAIEAIAVEVERIGEAQRFTTKLLAERPSDAAQHLVVQPRREPGTITPH
jgi:hypothetical protein